MPAKPKTPKDINTKADVKKMEKTQSNKNTDLDEKAVEAAKRALELDDDAIEAANEVPTDDGAAEGFADPAAFLAAELDKTEKERDEAKDRYMRAQAEMENLRRRTQKDIADAREFSIAGFAREMIAVSDNLRRALDAIPEQARQSEEAGFKPLIEGVEMTERAMLQALEKHGVKKISPLNERFDPNVHQAMFEVPNTEVPQNTVLEVVQDGFVIGSRCLRPAMVGVSKGGPKTGSKQTSEVASEAQTDEQNNGNAAG